MLDICYMTYVLFSLTLLFGVYIDSFGVLIIPFCSIVHLWATVKYVTERTIKARVARESRCALRFFTYALTVIILLSLPAILASDIALVCIFGFLWLP